MTLEMARWKARCLATTTGEPAVIFRCPISGWEVWHTLAAAKWLAQDGELVIPDQVRDPEETERQLRLEAAKLRGTARLKLLEAAMDMRCRRGRRHGAA